MLALLLAFSAVVQLNDPDPLPWFSIYAAGSLLCAVAVAKRLPWFVPAVVGGVAAGWAVVLVPRFMGQGDYWALLNVGGGMTGERSEYAREASGLLIEAGAMAFLTVARRRQRRLQ